MFKSDYHIKLRTSKELGNEFQEKMIEIGSVKGESGIRDLEQGGRLRDSGKG